MGDLILIVKVIHIIVVQINFIEILFNAKLL
jgi:hypothetical protein